MPLPPLGTPLPHLAARARAAAALAAAESLDFHGAATPAAVRAAAAAEVKWRWFKWVPVF